MPKSTEGPDDVLVEGQSVSFIAWHQQNLSSGSKVVYPCLGMPSGSKLVAFRKIRAPDESIASLTLLKSRVWLGIFN